MKKSSIIKFLVFSLSIGFNIIHFWPNIHNYLTNYGIPEPIAGIFCLIGSLTAFIMFIGIFESGQKPELLVAPIILSIISFGLCIQLLSISRALPNKNKALKIEIYDDINGNKIQIVKSPKGLSPNQRELLKKRKLVPPVGFSIVNNEFHRSSTCLVLDTKTDKCYILGQDEGTYFGCELVDMVATVKEAFESLIPLEVQGKLFQRQGEWFGVPVNKKDLPKEEDIVLGINPGKPYLELDRDNYTSAVVLQRDGADSNRHSFVEFKNLLIDKNRKIFVENGKLTHSQHKTIVWEGWMTFYKNTAVRSFSVKGVD